MSKNDLRDAIIQLLAASGLSFDDQIKAISEARVSIQPRASQRDWRADAKPILKPKEKKERA